MAAARVLADDPESPMGVTWCVGSGLSLLLDIGAICWAFAGVGVPCLQSLVLPPARRALAGWRIAREISG